MTKADSMLLSVQNLSVSYGAGPVVNQVSLDVEHGAVVALFGANGAGKSSTLRAIAGLEALQGSLYFDGKIFLKPRTESALSWALPMFQKGEPLSAT